MPCRPASHGFNAEDGGVSREAALASRAHRRATVEALQSWATDPASTLHGDARRRIAATDDGGLDDTFPNCPTAVRAGNREVIGEWSMEMAFRADREEKLLCEARCVLAYVARTSDPPPAGIAPLVDEQLSLHRVHRNGDRAAARAALMSEIDYLRSGAQTSAHITRLSALRERVEALDGMSDEALWEDRTALTKLWP